MEITWGGYVIYIWKFAAKAVRGLKIVINDTAIVPVDITMKNIEQVASALTLWCPHTGFTQLLDKNLYC